MIYRLEIYDDIDQYARLQQGDVYTNSISLTVDDKDKAFALIDTFVSSGKVVTILSEDTPF